MITESCGVLTQLVYRASNCKLVYVFYQSPSSSTDNNNYLMDLIAEVTRSCKSHLLIMVNFPDIN